jgi:hypothetical protein
VRCSRRALFTACAVHGVRCSRRALFTACAVHGVPGPPHGAASVIARRPGARYRETIWPRS